MDFEQRLQRAIERGRRTGNEAAKVAEEQALNEEECKRLHSQYRLALSEHIERCVRRVVDHFPGFRYEAVVGERGWGAAVSRDDAGRDAERGRQNFYSRLELAVRPYSQAHVLEVGAKGTIRNKEVFNRSQYRRLAEVDMAAFEEMVNMWILEYAELFATKG